MRGFPGTSTEPIACMKTLLRACKRISWSFARRTDFLIRPVFGDGLGNPSYRIARVILLPALAVLLPMIFPGGGRAGQQRNSQSGPAAGEGELLHRVPRQRRRVGQGEQHLFVTEKDLAAGYSLAAGASLPGLPRRRSGEHRFRRGPFARQGFQGGEIAGRRPGVLRQLPCKHRIHAAITAPRPAPINWPSTGPAATARR